MLVSGVKCPRFISNLLFMLTPEQAKQQMLSPEERCKLAQ